MKKYSTLSEEVISLHEFISKEWPKLLRIAVALYDKKTDMLHTFIRSSYIENILNHYSYPLSKVDSLLEIANTKQSRVLDDLSILKSDTQHTKEIILNGFKSSFTVPMYLNNTLLGFIFFDSTETKYFNEKLKELLLKYSRLIESLIISDVLPIKSLIGVINTTRDITKIRDEETGEHLVRMANYTELIALELSEKYNLSDEDIEYIWFYAPLHDIGKIAISDNILMKPSSLTKEEYEVIKTHVNEGIKMLELITSNFDFQELHHLDILKKIISEHHEKINGSGYPKGLKGNEISIIGKIVAVADVFDALTSSRIYKKALSIDETFQYLKKNKNILFDEDCVEALIKNKTRVIEIHNKFNENKSIL